MLLRAVQLHRNCSVRQRHESDTQGKVKQSLTAMEIANAAASDASARETLEVYCAHLAQCLSTVVNLLDPDVIVLVVAAFQYPTAV